MSQQTIKDTFALENEVVTMAKHETLTQIMVGKFFQNKLAVTGLIMLSIIVLAAVFAPFIAQHDPNFQSLRLRLQDPSLQFWFGTDDLGRDIFSRVLYAGRVSLMVGFMAMLGAVTIGSVLGALAGYFGGWVDSVIMRFVDIMISIPTIFLLITMVAVYKPSLTILIGIFAILSWMGTARLVRGEFLSLKHREYVLAARTMGMSNTRIIFTQILPNAAGPIIVAATLAVGGFILAESALSFLGLGVQPPTASWGNMLTNAQSIRIMQNHWYYPFFPGFMILITVLSFNFIGDGLRDALDPKVIRK